MAVIHSDLLEPNGELEIIENFNRIMCIIDQMKEEDATLHDLISDLNDRITALENA